MNHLFRLAYFLLTSPFAKRIDFKDPCTTNMRVWPTDLDPLLHMNNGVYLSLMDLGRIDFMIKTGAWKKINEAGLYPVIASEGIKFKRSLKPFQKFEIRTKNAGWDEKFVYLEQNFWSKGQLCASAIIKAKFLKKKGGKVDTEELKKIIGLEEDVALKPHANDIFMGLEEAYNQSK